MFGKAIYVKDMKYWEKQTDRMKTENMRYYTDNETKSEPYGVWRSRHKEGASPISLSIKDGDRVEWEQADKLTRRRDPETGDLLYETKVKSPYGAQDMTNGAPKPISILHGASKAIEGTDHPLAELAGKIAKVIEDAHIKANDLSMNWLFDQGAFQVRSGHAGKDREGASAITWAEFVHYTSRKGDMHLHTHNVIPNVARRADGSFSAWDNYGYTLLRHEASALYRAEMCADIKAGLAEFGIHVEFERDGRNLKISGIPQELTKHFSKRREAVVKKLQEWGIKDSATHREAAQIAAYQTRDKKEDLPPMPILHKMWTVEMKAMGYSFESLLENIQMSAKKIEADRNAEYENAKVAAALAEKPIPATEYEYRIEKAKEKAVNNVIAMSSAFEARKFRQAVAEAMQEHGGAKIVLEQIAKAQDEAGTFEIAKAGRGKTEPVHTTVDRLVQEWSILDNVKAMRGNLAKPDQAFIREFFDRPITNAYGETFYLKDEQKELGISFFQGNQFDLAEGDPGTGKTTVMQVVRQCAEAQDKTVWIAGPTNKSVDVLRAEVGIPTERAFSVAGLIFAYDKGDLKLTSKDFIMIDEAGMISTSDMLRLTEIARKTGAELKEVGDRKQLPSVLAGAPFGMLMDVYGGERMKDIARQKVAWMNEASKAAADGRIGDCIQAYRDHGLLKICEDAEGVYAAAVEEFFNGDPNEALIITKTNAENAMINEMIEAKKIELGLLRGGKFEEEVLQRGSDGKPTVLSFMEGQRIIIGENVKFHGVKVANNTAGTIKQITQREGFPAEWTVEFDDGKTLKFIPSQFIGFRESDDPNKHIPKIAKADALTDYACQGFTAKRVSIATTSDLSKESALVMYTRHKHMLKIFIDGAKHETNLAVNEPKSFSISKDGKANPLDDAVELEYAPEAVVKDYIAGCENESGKNNACDYLGGAKTFYNSANSAEELREKVLNKAFTSREKDKMEAENKTASVTPEAPENEGPIMPKGVGRIGGVPSTEEMIKRQAEARAKALEAQMKRTYEAKPNKAPAKKAQTPKPQINDDPNKKSILTSGELNQFVRDVNLPDFIREVGRMGDYKKEGNYFVFRYGQSTQNPKGNQLNVRKGDSGMWIFATRDKSAGGDIRDFVAWQKGMNRKEAEAWLRDEFKTAKSYVELAPRKEMSPREKLESYAAKTYDAARFTKIKEWWNKGTVAVSAYLLSRKIEKETQALFRDDFRCEGKTATYDGQNKGGVMFAMKDVNMEITGFARKGYKHPLAKRSFSKNADGTEVNLIALGDPYKAKRVYVGEAIIDCMALYQKHGRPDEGQVALLATGGSPANTGLGMLFKIAKDNTGAEFINAGQNDDQDFIHANQMKAAILEGNPQASFTRELPSAKFKDHTDELNGIEMKVAQPEPVKAPTRPTPPTPPRPVYNPKKPDEPKPNPYEEARGAKPRGPSF